MQTRRQHARATTVDCRSAVAGPHHGIVELLLDAGVNPNAKQQHGFTPLHAAVQSGDAQLTELLLAHGADPTAVSDDAKTAIDLAHEAGDDELLEVLRRPPQPPMTRLG